MSLYAYKILTENGEVRQGEVVSASADALRQSLMEQGFLVQKISRKHQFTVPLLQRRRHISLDELIIFNQELIALLRAGLTIPESLTLIQGQAESSRLGQYLKTILKEIKNGVSISAACAQYPDVFEKLFVSSLRTGEKTGDMAGVLERYKEYLIKRNELKKKIAQALAYPVFLLITFSVIMSVMFAFVVPRFVALYADFSTAMPTATQILFEFVKHFPFYLAAGAVSLVLVWLTYRYLNSTDEGGYKIDYVKCKLPLFGNIYVEQTYVQITRTLATLLHAGTSLVQAMRAVAESLNNRVYIRKIETATRLVEEGNSLANAMSETALLPPRAVGMIKVGEATGGLDAMFDSVTQFYEGQLDIRLRKLMSLIEPALMLLMGFLVGTVIIVMYLPIFGMANILQ
ncbi:MAG: type II secretion system F family protein [Gammaproteobacteria bacterium]|nr:type II secretion system F family protein [Gammaproteobacteria bacterium]MDH5654167.1 type II secretion system F family protein [Gammaproteobacteria bacterium]